MKIILLSALVAMALPLASSAQILSNENDVVDMQLSRNYYYGEGTETFDSTAMAKALDNLIANAGSCGATVNLDSVEYYYYFTETGGIRYIHVYAFLEKSTVPSVVAIAQPVSPDGSEVSISNIGRQDTNGDTIPLLIDGTNQPIIEQTKWKLEAIEYLVKCEDLPSALERLERMIVTKKVAEYGRYQDCNDKTSVCWAIFDSGNRLVAILGIGNTARYNYKTKKTDYLEQYINSSYKVLWFLIDD